MTLESPWPDPSPLTPCLCLCFWSCFYFCLALSFSSIFVIFFLHKYGKLTYSTLTSMVAYPLFLTQSMALAFLHFVTQNEATLHLFSYNCIRPFFLPLSTLFCIHFGLINHPFDDTKATPLAYIYAPQFIASLLLFFHSLSTPFSSLMLSRTAASKTALVGLCLHFISK